MKVKKGQEPKASGPNSKTTGSKSKKTRQKSNDMGQKSKQMGQKSKETGQKSKETEQKSAAAGPKSKEAGQKSNQPGPNIEMVKPSEENTTSNDVLKVKLPPREIQDRMEEWRTICIQSRHMKIPMIDKIIQKGYSNPFLFSTVMAPDSLMFHHVCSVCRVVCFQTESELRPHEDWCGTSSGVGSKSFLTCETCGRAYHSASALDKHRASCFNTVNVKQELDTESPDIDQMKSYESREINQPSYESASSCVSSNTSSVLGTVVKFYENPYDFTTIYAPDYKQFPYICSSCHMVALKTPQALLLHEDWCSISLVVARNTKECPHCGILFHCTIAFIRHQEACLKQISTFVEKAKPSTSRASIKKTKSASNTPQNVLYSTKRMRSSTKLESSTITNRPSLHQIDKENSSQVKLESSISLKESTQINSSAAKSKTQLLKKSNETTVSKLQKIFSKCEQEVLARSKPKTKLQIRISPRRAVVADKSKPVSNDKPVTSILENSIISSSVQTELQVQKCSIETVRTYSPPSKGIASNIIIVKTTNASKILGVSSTAGLGKCADVNRNAAPMVTDTILQQANKKIVHEAIAPLVTQDLVVPEIKKSESEYNLLLNLPVETDAVETVSLADLTVRTCSNSTLDSSILAADSSLSNSSITTSETEHSVVQTSSTVTVSSTSEENIHPEGVSIERTIKSSHENSVLNTAAVIPAVPLLNPEAAKAAYQDSAAAISAVPLLSPEAAKAAYQDSAAVISATDRAAELGSSILCPVCDESLASFLDLSQHISKQHNISYEPQLSSSPYSDSPATTGTGFVKYRGNLHASSRNTKATCNDCLTLFDSRLALSRHRKYCPGKMGNRLLCAICVKVFDEVSKYKEHIENEHGTKSDESLVNSDDNTVPDVLNMIDDMSTSTAEFQEIVQTDNTQPLLEFETGHEEQENVSDCVQEIILIPEVKAEININENDSANNVLATGVDKENSDSALDTAVPTSENASVAQSEFNRVDRNKMLHAADINLDNNISIDSTNTDTKLNDTFSVRQESKLSDNSLENGANRMDSASKDGISNVIVIAKRGTASTESINKTERSLIIEVTQAPRQNTSVSKALHQQSNLMPVVTLSDCCISKGVNSNKDSKVFTSTPKSKSALPNSNSTSVSSNQVDSNCSTSTPPNSNFPSVSSNQIVANCSTPTSPNSNSSNSSNQDESLKGIKLIASLVKNSNPRSGTIVGIVRANALPGGSLNQIQIFKKQLEQSFVRNGNQPVILVSSFQPGARVYAAKSNADLNASSPVNTHSDARNSAGVDKSFANSTETKSALESLPVTNFPGYKNKSITASNDDSTTDSVDMALANSCSPQQRNVSSKSSISNSPTISQPVYSPLYTDITESDNLQMSDSPQVSPQNLLFGALRLIPRSSPESRALLSKSRPARVLRSFRQAPILEKLEEEFKGRKASRNSKVIKTRAGKRSTLRNDLSKSSGENIFTNLTSRSVQRSQSQTNTCDSKQTDVDVCKNMLAEPVTLVKHAQQPVGHSEVISAESSSNPRSRPTSSPVTPPKRKFELNITEVDNNNPLKQSRMENTERSDVSLQSSMEMDLCENMARRSSSRSSLFQTSTVSISPGRLSSNNDDRTRTRSSERTEVKIQAEKPRNKSEMISSSPRRNISASAEKTSPKLQGKSNNESDEPKKCDTSLANTKQITTDSKAQDSVIVESISKATESDKVTTRSSNDSKLPECEVSLRVQDNYTRVTRHSPNKAVSDASSPSKDSKHSPNKTGSNASSPSKDSKHSPNKTGSDVSSPSKDSNHSPNKTASNALSPSKDSKHSPNKTGSVASSPTRDAKKQETRSVTMSKSRRNIRILEPVTDSSMKCMQCGEVLTSMISIATHDC